MIKGYGELMRDIPGEMSPENMQIVIDETERLSELVNDLLDLSQLQEGKKNFACTVFNLTQTIREVLTRYDTFVHHRGYTLSFDAPHDVFVLADRIMIIQALYNLINNAINYTGDDCLVQVTQSVMGDTVRISVRDTGQGIEPDQLPMIWDRYYKVDKVHRRAMVGTGIGLSIVKEIFETHHAAYGVITNSGMGTTFWYELPIVAPPNTDN
jgi:signal transduction histidine kinase